MMYGIDQSNHIYYVKGKDRKVCDFLDEKYYAFYIADDVYALSAIEVVDALSLARNKNERNLDIYVEDKDNYTEIIEDTIYLRPMTDEEVYNATKDVDIFNNIEDFKDDKQYALFPTNDALEEELDEEYNFDDYLILNGEELKDLILDFQITPVEVILFEYNQHKEKIDKEIIFTNGLFL